MAKTITGTELDQEQHHLVTELLGLTDLVVVSYKRDTETQKIKISCVPRKNQATCPSCQRDSQKVHDYPKQRQIHDTLLAGKAIILCFDTRRFFCDNCKKAFTQEIADVVPDCTYTHRLYKEITNPRRKQDVATLSKLYGVGYKTVESMILKAGQAKIEKRHTMPLMVRKLGIDEISKKRPR